VLDPPLVSVRAANIPVASVPYKPTINEVLPPAAAVPLMPVAIWCVWAAHCAPEVLSDHKSAPEVSSAHKSTPEVPSDHKSAPVVPSDHKPTPEVSSAHKSAPEVPSVYKSASEISLVHGSVSEPSSHQRSDPEASSDRESAPEASSVHESTPVPLEVAAPAAEPPEGAAFPFGLSARQVTAELATNKLSPSLLVILSASAVPTLPRSQFMTRLPAPPWWAPAPPALPWRAPALTQSSGPPQGLGPPTLALSRPVSPPPQSCNLALLFSFSLSRCLPFETLACFFGLLFCLALLRITFATDRPLPALWITLLSRSNIPVCCCLPCLSEYVFVSP
ncbi:hypothetical protein M9458_023241, partial [Cirrhinus mrigala]